MIYAYIGITPTTTSIITTTTNTTTSTTGKPLVRAKHIALQYRQYDFTMSPNDHLLVGRLLCS